MAKTGLLGQSKPAATTNTVLYTAATDKSASAVLTVANDGTAATYKAGIKDYAQNLAMDASTYKFHKGDIITNQRFTLSSNIPSSANLPPGTQLTSSDGEKKAKFHAFYIPQSTEIDVQSVSIRVLTTSAISGDWNEGTTITKGSGGNTTTATVYDAYSTFILVGPSTINGSGSEFAASDSVTAGSGGTATIATGGVGAAGNEFVLSTDGSTFGFKAASGDYSLSLFQDRTYKFDVSHASMANLDFSLSTVVNGEWGPDGTAGNSDDGTEYTDGRTASGTPGNAGAHVTFDFTVGNPATTLYIYDGTTGTAANSGYGGTERAISTSSSAQYNSIYVYDVEGTWVNSTDGFLADSTTYTVSGQTAGKWGVVRDYTGSALKVIQGVGSGAFAGSDIFLDSPLLTGAARSFCTVSSITTDTTVLEAQHYIVDDKNVASGTYDRVTSVVLGPGESLIVQASAQNNVFTLDGFEDATSELGVRNYT